MVAGLIETAQIYLRAQLQPRPFALVGRTAGRDAVLAAAGGAGPRASSPSRGASASIGRAPAAPSSYTSLPRWRFALAHETLMAIWLQWRFADARFAMYLTKMVTAYLAIDVLVYWGVVGGCYAIDSARELRRRELAAWPLQSSLTAARLRSAAGAGQSTLSVQHAQRHFRPGDEGGRGAGVTRTLGLLSDLLRLTLDGGMPQEVPLSKELELTDIVTSTFSGCAFPTVWWSSGTSPPDTLVALVPSFVLQPLVENAVVHGIESGRKGGGSSCARCEMAALAYAGE